MEDLSILKLNHHYSSKVFGITVYYFQFEGWNDKCMTLSKKLYKQIIKDGFVKL